MVCCRLVKLYGQNKSIIRTTQEQSNLSQSSLNSQPNTNSLKSNPALIQPQTLSRWCRMMSLLRGDLLTSCVQWWRCSCPASAQWQPPVSGSTDGTVRPSRGQQRDSSPTSSYWNPLHPPLNQQPTHNWMSFSQYGEPSRLEKIKLWNYLSVSKHFYGEMVTWNF